jgi:hypothetical protein
MPETDFSLSFWLDLDSTGFQYIIMCGDSGETFGTNFHSFRIGSGGTLNYFGEYGSGTNISAVSASAPFSLDGWHHYVITVAGNSISIYKDASLIETFNRSDTPTGVPDLSAIGINRDGNVSGLNGRLDQFRIYNYVIGQSAIDALYAEV